MKAPYVSALSLAVHRKHFDVVRLFLKNGTDPSLMEEFGESPYGLSILQVWASVVMLFCRGA